LAILHCLRGRCGGLGKTILHAQRYES
jgi:hypothetical protein